MTDSDPFATQQDASGSLIMELAAAGFEAAQEIGRGGFGVVYRCTQAALDRTVAVKVLTADLDEQNRKRFLREQRAAGRLTGHPNVVTVLQVGVTDSDRPFIVMPYFAQGSLDAQIRRHGSLPLEDALRLGERMAGALETAHRHGILHRDVKPGNILLTDYAEPALTDFGIAHIAGGFETTAGVVTGSPAFTAPEVIAGAPASPAADVYGLGATLFAALTGHAAFERRSGEQLVAQFLRITAEPVPDPRTHDIPDDVSTVIENAMSSDSLGRPSAADLAQQLRQCRLRRGVPLDRIATHPESEVPPPDPAKSSSSADSRSPGVLTRSSRTGELPLELTSFVDRRTELVEAKNLLSAWRLVTLSGIGGVGKTRLALRVAANVRRDFSDGVYLVELGELRDESLVVDVVAAAVGLVDRSARPVQEVLVEFLRPRTVLLVLDNCEQVVDAAATLADALLRACPDLRILATSRESFGIDGEAVLTVHPLPVPDPDHLPRGLPRGDALTLFAERGAAAVPGFELTENNKLTVARICRRLDGLPLPIELAAARLRAMSPEQILARLTDRYALLTRGHRGAPTRQQTLRSCIDWSFDLCTAQEQLLWGRLSVFAGSIDFDAAEQICGSGFAQEEFLDAMTSLVEKSILIREECRSGVRFRLLETLRDYGHDTLEQTGEAAPVRRRHRDWYEMLVLTSESEAISARQIELIARLRRDLPNIRAALEFCLDDDPTAGMRIAAALHFFWTSQGLHDEGRRWLDRLRPHQTGPLTVTRAKALYTNSFLAGVQGDLRAAAALVEQGYALTDEVTEPLARAHLALADCSLALFERERHVARSRLESAVEVYTAQNDLLFQVIALGTLGMLHDRQNDTERAIACLQRVVAITETRGESVYRSYMLWALGVAIWRSGDNARAIQLLGQALQLDRLVNDPINASICLQALAWIAADERDTRRAGVLMGAAEELRSGGSSAEVPPALLVYQNRCESAVRQALGEQAFAAARREGAAFGFAAAVAYAQHEQVSPAKTSTGPSSTPTKRERQVADLIAEGLTNKEIAARLVISPRTAQGHVEHLLAKLGFTSRAQIAAWVVESQNMLSDPRASEPPT